MELVKESGKGWGPKACESIYTVPSLKGFLGFSKLKVVSKGPGVFVLLTMFAALLLSKRIKMSSLYNVKQEAHGPERLPEYVLLRRAQI